MRWRIATASAFCPKLEELRYWRGTFSNAQLVLTFGPTSTLTIDPDMRPGGAPAWVNGTAFAPQSQVILTVADEVLRETQTDAAGRFESAIYVPKIPPGRYVLVARDSAGHVAQAPLTVIPGLWP